MWLIFVSYKVQKVVAITMPNYREMVYANAFEIIEKHIIFCPHERDIDYSGGIDLVLNLILLDIFGKMWNYNCLSHHSAALKRRSCLISIPNRNNEIHMSHPGFIWLREFFEAKTKGINKCDQNYRSYGFLQSLHIYIYTYVCVCLCVLCYGIFHLHFNASHLFSLLW